MSGTNPESHAAASKLLDESRLLLLSGYTPRDSHVPLSTLKTVVEAALSQVGKADIRSRVDALRACSVALSGAIAAASSALDEVDPLVYLQLLAVEVMFVDVADELERRAGWPPVQV